MDFATIIGLIGAISIILAAVVMGGSIFMFIDLTALLIVILGTILIILIRWDLSKLMMAVKVLLQAFYQQTSEPLVLINNCLNLAKIARKSGILSLDSIALDNLPLLKQAVQLLLEGYDQKAVNEILTKDMNLTYERHAMGQAVFENVVEVAPAMGLIGTLIALIQMLANMSDPDALGPAMAMALLSTLYGLMIANIVFAPLVDKLAYRSQQECLLRQIVIDAMSGMQSGQTTQTIELSLKAYLPPMLRFKISSEQED